MHALDYSWVASTGHSFPTDPIAIINVGQLDAGQWISPNLVALDFGGVTDRPTVRCK